jgi:hypothetical protein
MKHISLEFCGWGNLCYTETESLKTVLPSTTWKVGNVELLSKVIYKVDIQSASWFLFTAYSKVPKERNKLRKE